MAIQRKQLTDADVAKMRDIEAYTHDDKKRSNNPLVGMAQHDKEAENVKTYAFDPHIDPTLEWAGKNEGLSFDVPTSSIHIHESIKPHKIIRSVQAIGDDYEDQQLSLFETPVERMRRRRDAIEFYQHGVSWTNRMIAGDSLVIMNSLLEKEGMAGQVQMVYIDPPYGIKYSSNFQPFVNDNSFKSSEKDEDLTQEPEMLTAFRDTWELGIHSYLSYLRNRLLLARELLSETGNVFIQISDENVHRIRLICDEIFGVENYVAQINFRKKTMPLGAKHIEQMCDFIIWYAKDKSKIKYHTLFQRTQWEGDFHYKWYMLPDGKYFQLSEAQKKGFEKLPDGAKVYLLKSLVASGTNPSGFFDYEFEGKIYKHHPQGYCTTREGLERLERSNRIQVEGNRLTYRYFVDDYPVSKLLANWNDTIGAKNKLYVVQTNPEVIQRCMLMTTDPGDLVLDITCGSGTTAFVAEQWGRRWITCDTSRIAITLAKQRLMTATFDYYKLAQEDQGVGSGFIYKTVPHISLGSIANGEDAPEETLYDQPIVDKTKIRITGPFTVEALPAPVVKPLDDVSNFGEDIGVKLTDWRDQLRATGIMGRGGNRLEFSRVEPLSGTKFLQAEAETKEETPRRAVICFAGETKPLDSRMVAMAMDEAENMRPTPQLIIFAAFQFDPEAAKVIDDTKWPGVTLLKAQMNTDLMTEDLKKKRSSDQSFWLVGQPDVELIRDGRSKTKYKVKVNGFDYYDVKKGTVESGSTSRIAMWMLDTDYDGMCIEPKQVLFPMGGKNDGWNKLAKTLHAEIDQNLIEKYAGNESLWFDVQPNSSIVVKIIDDRGIESLKVIRIGEE